MFGIFDVLGADLVFTAMQIDEHRILGTVHSDLSQVKRIRTRLMFDREKRGFVEKKDKKLLSQST